MGYSKNDVGKILSFLSLGMINVRTDGTTLKDPLTGTKDLAFSAYDSITHNFSIGVWIGRRSMHHEVFNSKFGFGLDSIATRAFNLSLSHMVVRVNG